MTRRTLKALPAALLLFTTVSVCVGVSRNASAQVLAGIDVLQRDNFQTLAGKRVGLITNQTGVNFEGKSTVQLMHESDNVDLVALFSPEHGFAGKLDQSVIGDATDNTTGLTIYSLYGKTRIPTPEMLRGIDVLIFDIQDIGTRFYTYISTMGGAMKAAGEQGISFYVLDRPNPIDGLTVQGPVLDPGDESFVGYHNISVRHGMTVGELARMFQAEQEIGVDLHVVTMQGWERANTFDQTGRLWVNPSPNMRCLTQALIYPGIGLIETTNVSVGRGTDTPFEVIGAPWIDPIVLARELNASELPGARFVPVRFTPDSSKFANELCGGVNIVVTDREEFHPLRTGLTVMVVLRNLHPKQWETKSLNRLLADAMVLNGVLEGKDVPSIETAFQDELAEFVSRRKRFLIYR